MKNKLILLAMLTFVLAACDQEQPIRNCTGIIVATLGCYESEYDKSDISTYHEGYVILTSNNDTILSFDVEVTDSIHRGYGMLRIFPEYEIPYKFSYRILTPEDKRYVQYDPPCQDCYRPSFPKPKKQATVTRCK